MDAPIRILSGLENRKKVVGSLNYFSFFIISRQSNREILSSEMSVEIIDGSFVFEWYGKKLGMKPLNIPEKKKLSLDECCPTCPDMLWFW